MVTCMKCGQKGPHYVPPLPDTVGFFTCDPPDDITRHAKLKDGDVFVVGQGWVQPQPLRLWLYESRNARPEVYYRFSDARKQQDSDNRCSVEDILEDGELDVSGSEEEGYFSIDDGGSIRLVEVK